MPRKKTESVGRGRGTRRKQEARIKNVHKRKHHDIFHESPQEYERAHEYESPREEPLWIEV